MGDAEIEELSELWAEAADICQKGAAEVKRLRLTWPALVGASVIILLIWRLGGGA